MVGGRWSVVGGRRTVDGGRRTEVARYRRERSQRDGEGMPRRAGTSELGRFYRGSLACCPGGAALPLRVRSQRSAVLLLGEIAGRQLVDNQSEGFKFECRRIPENLVVHPVVTVCENIPHADDAVGTRNSFKGLRRYIAKPEEGFTDDFEFPFENELKGSVGE